MRATCSVAAGLSIVAIVLGLFLLGLMFLYSRMETVQADYVFFCLVFMLLFYILPAVLISAEGSVVYAYRIYNFSQAEIQFISGSMVVFLLGFFLTELLISHRESVKRKSRSHRASVAPNTIRYMHSSVLVGTLGMLSTILLYMLLIGYSSTVLEVRAGAIQGNYFISLMLSGCLVTTVYCMAAMERSEWYYKLIPIVLIVGFSLQLGGRTTLLFSIAYAGILFGLNLKKAVAMSLVLFPVMLPLIRDGKTLIYAIATGVPLGDFHFTLNFNYTDFANIYFDTIIINFAHPVISLITAPQLVESIGYRYFYDYIHGFLFYARLVGIDAGDSLTYMNTEIILGARRSTVPTGYVAFGYIQLSMIGIFVSGCFYRFLGYASLKFLKLGDKSSKVLRFHITLLCAYSFYTGEIRTMVVTVFFPIIVVKILQKLGRS